MSLYEHFVLQMGLMIGTYFVHHKENLEICVIKKKESHKNKLYNELFDARHDQNKLWKAVKRQTLKGLKVNACISVNEWQKHFQSLLNTHVGIDNEFAKSVHEYVDNHNSSCDICDNIQPDVLNNETTEYEIMSVISSPANNMAPGLDGISNELFKNTANIVMPYLKLAFNKIMLLNYFPAKWSNAMLIP